jgi:hypothetical protein
MPLRPKPPGHFAGLGSASGGAPTFPQLARTAGTIFAGTVTKIEAGPAAGGSAVPTVAITLQVEHPLRGSLPGGSLTILEWLGLSSSGQRYVIGEHVLLFLYPPSNLGLVILSVSQVSVQSDANGTARMIPSTGGFSGPLEIQVSATAGPQRRFRTFCRRFQPPRIEEA